jgi:hypothetical protein
MLHYGGIVMAIEVFKRTELKYLISDDVYRLLRPQLEEYMEADAFSRGNEAYTICNIYYDTPQHELIRKSIEKPIYKEKLRLRSYGTIGVKDKVFLEIKKKYNGQVYKRRTSMQYEEAIRYLETKERARGKRSLNEQILCETDQLLIRFPDLRPTLYLSYDRTALFGIDNPGFRITFDTNIRTRRQNIGLDRGNYGELLLPPEIWVMEVKMNNAAPLWFTSLLSVNHIYPTTFSKYGEEYRKAVLTGTISSIGLKQNIMCV